MLDDVAGTPRERQGSGRRKMLVRIIAFSLCLTFLICIWIKVTDYRDFRRDLTTYQGVKLGDSMGEIKYALGYPPFVLGPETHDAEFDGYFQYVYQTDGKDPKNAMPDGKKVEDFLYWAYEETDRRIDLAFDPNTKGVSEIGCYVNSTAAGGKSGYCTALFGIDSNSTEANVLAALGTQDAQKFSGPSKSLRYRSLGLEVTLSKRRVYMLRKPIWMAPVFGGFSLTASYDPSRSGWHDDGDREVWPSRSREKHAVVAGAPHTDSTQHRSPKNSATSAHGPGSYVREEEDVYGASLWPEPHVSG